MMRPWSFQIKSYSSQACQRFSGRSSPLSTLRPLCQASALALSHTPSSKSHLLLKADTGSALRTPCPAPPKFFARRRPPRGSPMAAWVADGSCMVYDPSTTRPVEMKTSGCVHNAFPWRESRNRLILQPPVPHASTVVFRRQVANPPNAPAVARVYLMAAVGFELPRMQAHNLDFALRASFDSEMEKQAPPPLPVLKKRHLGPKLFAIRTRTQRQLLWSTSQFWLSETARARKVD
mmetsp:Transcript_11641/g.29439  ORF Transcript_11641/g.29439 Transcript_11641/m.29439 type:complete len:235 (-) Transcript_11641:792-1496(-)